MRSAQAARSCSCISGTLQNILTKPATIGFSAIICQSQLPRGAEPSKYQDLTRQHTVPLSYTHSYPTKPTFAIISLWVCSSTFFCRIFPHCPRPRSAFLPFASALSPSPHSPALDASLSGMATEGAAQGRGETPIAGSTVPAQPGPTGMGAPGPAPPRALREGTPRGWRRALGGLKAAAGERGGTLKLRAGSLGPAVPVAPHR